MQEGSEWVTLWDNTKHQGPSWCVLRFQCPPEPWLDLSGDTGSKTRAPPEISMWDPHLGAVVEMGWIGRVVVELCFRDMGTTGFKYLVHKR